MKYYIPILGLLLASLASPTVNAHSSNPSIETACMEATQGKVAWNYQGSKTWSPTNLKALCAGTQKAQAPRNCFHTVMHRNVSWGQSTRWKWENAVNLCAGTSNASATVYCFKGGLESGKTWQQAIKTCKSPTIHNGESAQNADTDTNQNGKSSTINSSGNVVVTYPDGSTREYFDGGMTVTQPNGQSVTSMYSTQAPAAIPPAVPDQVHQDWLDMHSRGLLNILSNLVNNDQTAIENYLNYEGSDSSVYESIQLRGKTIELLLP